MRKFHLSMVSLMALWIALAPPLADTAGANEPWVVKVVSVQGHVEARKTGTTHWFAVKLNDHLQPGDMIRLHENSRASVALPNETILRLDQNTTVTFSALEKQQTWLVDLLRGTAYFFSRIPRTLRVATPFVNGSVEGTEFLVTVEAGGAILTVLEGKLLAENREGSLVLASGDTAIALADQAPKPRVVVRPRDSVQWALHYPFLVNYEPEDLVGRAGGGWPAVAARSRDFYWQGDSTQALSIIEGVPENNRTARFFIYHASLLLSVGRVERAQSDLRKALQVDPSQGEALALEALVALTQNRKAEADELIRRAAGLSPASPVVKLALSYVRQAHFDLQSAMTGVEESLRLDSKNALTWARLSDLHLSFGYLDKALEAAQEAAARNPHLSLTQTVLGFAYLMQIKINESKEAFEKAISLDQADPLPRLGLGLAKIRDGDLDDGRREIEIAVSLAPNNSLMRSYLGKAFYDEKRDKLAAAQFALAKELDPMDPTPWFYDAIHKQTANRPVEALRDIQKSIELNDNRAVYRSRLLLDQDLAARSASLGRIFGDLGFRPLALVEGWKSLYRDPGNYSAHRLLADSYSTRPRREIARVSELLQSQLLQPLNTTPVQPRLAEAKLSVPEGAGPSDPSFNEFNPLFLRNRFAFQGSGLVGGNETVGDELVQSGLWRNLSYSLGQYHYETDGFRPNNDLTENIFNAFVQTALSYKTSLQAEFRYVEKETGDLPLRFDPANFTPSLRQEENSRSVRFGFHHAFSPQSLLLGSLIYKDADFDTRFGLRRVITLPFPFPPLVFQQNNQLNGEQEGYLAELQHQFRPGSIRIISGLGYFDATSEKTDTVNRVLPLPASTTETREETDNSHTNLYLYSYTNLPETVTWTIGASADFFEGAFVERDQVNPKLGVTWNPIPSTTLRAAAFRTLKRTLISSQTIEPTQVAGFNQFFDDAEGTDSWQYGAGIDQRLPSDLYAGAEYSVRDMEVPYRIVSPSSVVREADWEERSLLAYLFWAPLTWLATGIEYQYDHLERGDFGGTESVIELKTHRFSPFANFFHSSGFGLQLRATYVDQRGLFGNPVTSTSFTSGSDEFWVVDAGLFYRLPHRWGVVTLGVKNLFDEKFNYQDMDPGNPVIYPERYVFLRLTLAF